MEFVFRKKKIVFEIFLSPLDRLVLKFVSVLNRQKIDYVIVSGYIAILFGRSRNTEDVDLFVGETPFEKFLLLWNDLEKNGFWCINDSSPKNAFEHYLKDGLAIRFAEKGMDIPNFEIKFPKSKYNFYSLKNKVEVVLNGKSLNTSEMELQTAFKLYLGSEKDFEDAKHLYNVFKEHLDINLLKKHIKELKVEKQAEGVLWKKFQN